MNRFLTQFFHDATRCRAFASVLFILAGNLLPQAALAVRPASSQFEIQDLEGIRERVAEFVAQVFVDQPGETEVQIGSLDPRLRLPRCEQPLDIQHRNNLDGGGHLRLGVQCNGSKPWTLYVPVQVLRRLPVVVAAAPIGRGMPLAGSLLRVETREVQGGTEAYYLDPAQLSGAAARRTLAPGQVIGANDITQLKLVKRGQKVQLTTHAAGLAVTTTGVAMADGGQGERIPVRNERSKRVIYGRVSGSGEVEIRPERDRT